MCKDCKCVISFLALLILVFSFWTLGFSKWIIVASAAIILILEIIYITKEGCSCKRANTVSSELPVKEVKSDLPSRKEIKEVMSKAVTKKKVGKTSK